MLQNFAHCRERVIAHDVINRRRARNLGERIFIGRELGNRVEAVDNDL